MYTNGLNGLGAAKAPPAPYIVWNGVVYENNAAGNAALARAKADKLAADQAAAAAAAKKKADDAAAAAQKKIDDAAAAAKLKADTEAQARANAQRLKDLEAAERQAKIDASLALAKAQTEAIAPKQEAAQGFAPVAQNAPPVTSITAAEGSTTVAPVESTFNIKKYMPILYGVGALVALTIVSKQFGRR